MYSEKLEKLIEMALLDGELSEKEKKVLFKNAEKEGIDLDEFEMVLDAKLFENQKNETKTAPKSNKFGEFKKCPSCGSTVQSLQTKCIDCDYEFSGINANNSVNKLFELLNEAENERENNGTSIGNIITEFLGQGFGVVGVDKIDNKKKTIIKNFPIPTTKNDIIEFLALSVPNAKKSGNFFTQNKPEHLAHNKFVLVWKSKCEQIIMKARFSLKDDKKVLAEINNYAKELKIK